MKLIKRIFCVLLLSALSASVLTLPTACFQSDNDGPYNLDNLVFNQISVFANNPEHLTNDDVSELIINIESVILNQINSVVSHVVPKNDYTTNLKTIIKPNANVSGGAKITITAIERSKILKGSSLIEIDVNKPV